MSGSFAGAFRRFAQTVRHAPGLRAAAPLWNALRTPYRWLLAKAGGRGGVPVVVGGRTLRLDPEFASIGWESVEPESYARFAAAIGPGAVVFDLGAHVGTYAMIAAQNAGPAGVVVAFEPHPPTRVFLEKHLAWNGLADRVRVIGKCVGREAGFAEFYSSPEDPDAENSVVPRAGVAPVRVARTTIDEAAAELGLRPTFIKFDIEGGEWDALHGAIRTLAEARPTLLVSLHPKPLAALGVDEVKVLAFLADRGYEARVVGRDHEVHVWAAPRVPAAEPGAR